MSSNLFRFKKFCVSHSRSAMKIGVDGVLIGAWADVAGCRRALDAGCGCGVIALMCAQRNKEALIDAVDVDEPSVEEAAENFLRSPWAGRLGAIKEDFALFPPPERGYDLIVSNPPYFDSGVRLPDSARLSARHEAGFGPLSLIERANELLSPVGRLTFVLPADRADEIIAGAAENGLMPRRIALVSGRVGKPPKRALIELTRKSSCVKTPTVEQFALEEPLSLGTGVPTARYRELCHDFYLKF